MAARRKIPDTGTLDVDLGSFLLEIQRATLKDGEGKTVRELAEELGRSVNFVQEALQKARAAGCLVIDWRNYVRIDGRPMRIPVYRVVKRKG